MKLKNKNLISALPFAIAAAISVAIYLLIPRDNDGFGKLIICCIVSSEALSFINVLLYNVVSSKKKLPLVAGGYTVSAMYILICVAAAILFSAYYRSAKTTYLFFFAVLTVAFTVTSILIYLLGQTNAYKAEKVEKSCAAFKKLEYKISLICSDNDNPAYRTTLKKIAEAIKSCDQSSYVDTDSEVNRCIDELIIQLNGVEKSDEKIHSICERILSLINQRSAEVSQLKLGGI